jgi:hypothetical protein
MFPLPTPLCQVGGGDWNVSMSVWHDCSEDVVRSDWSGWVGRVLSVGTICPQSQDKIHHIYSLPIVRDLGQPLWEHSTHTFRTGMAELNIN